MPPFRPSRRPPGLRTDLPVIQLADQPTRSYVERIAADDYVRWVIEPRGGADPVRTPRCSVTGDIAHRFRSDIDGADAVIIAIGDVERVAGCRCCTGRKVKPCRCARTVEMSGGSGTTGYDRADSFRGFVNGTEGMLGEIGNVERITALRDPK